MSSRVTRQIKNEESRCARSHTAGSKGGVAFTCQVLGAGGWCSLSVEWLRYGSLFFQAIPVLLT